MAYATFRSVIVILGWAGLVFGGGWSVVEALEFYRGVKRSVYGRLVLLTIVGWLLTMYSLGLVATSYLFDDVVEAVWVVTPIFLVWGASMLMIAVVVRRWNRNAVALNDIYLHLDALVQERTAELSRQRASALNLNVVLEERVKKQAADLEQKLRELSGLRREMEGRETRLAELKRQFDDLNAELERTTRPENPPVTPP